MKNTLLPNLGHAVRRIRERQSWSQEMLAERANLNRTYVGELERGQAVPSLLTLEKLACAFNLSTSALIAQAESISNLSIPAGLMAIAG